MTDGGSWAVGLAALPASPMAWGLAILAGAALGTFFFGGLWWTVQRVAAATAPARWFLGSLVLRTGMVLVGFYLVGSGQPVRLGLCLLGFLLARAVVLRATRPRGVTVAPPAPGAPPCA